VYGPDTTHDVIIAHTSVMRVTFSVCMALSGNGDDPGDERYHWDVRTAVCSVPEGSGCTDEEGGGGGGLAATRQRVMDFLWLVYTLSVEHLKDAVTIRTCCSLLDYFIPQSHAWSTLSVNTNNHENGLEFVVNVTDRTCFFKVAGAQNLQLRVKMDTFPFILSQRVQIQRRFGTMTRNRCTYNKRNCVVARSQYVTIALLRLLVT
jgi:hypothetical protein